MESLSTMIADAAAKQQEQQAEREIIDIVNPCGSSINIGGLNDTIEYWDKVYAEIGDILKNKPRA